MAVVILRDTTVILARGFGVANVERGVPVTPATPFNIASVTKPISAVVALRLVERGLLDLDRPMTSYNGFADFCSGARANGGLFFGDYQYDTQPLTLRHLLSMTANGIPGTRFFYNPVSYSWASRPMAEVSHIPFSELTATLVFQPAGMTRSARITAGRLLSPASKRVMWQANRSPTGAVLPYGLGWYVQDYAGEQLLWHTGLWEGAYSALYLKAPERHLTLILLANSDGLRWDNRLDEASVERSPFAAAFLADFPR